MDVPPRRRPIRGPSDWPESRRRQRGFASTVSSSAPPSKDMDLKKELSLPCSGAASTGSRRSRERSRPSLAFLTGGSIVLIRGLVILSVDLNYHDVADRVLHHLPGDRPEGLTRLGAEAADDDEVLGI